MGSRRASGSGITAAQNVSPQWPPYLCQWHTRRAQERLGDSRTTCCSNVLLHAIVTFSCMCHWVSIYMLGNLQRANCMFTLSPWTYRFCVVP